MLTPLVLSAEVELPVFFVTARALIRTRYVERVSLPAVGIVILTIKKVGAIYCPIIAFVTPFYTGIIIIF